MGRLYSPSPPRSLLNGERLQLDMGAGEREYSRLVVGERLVVTRAGDEGLVWPLGAQAFRITYTH